MSSTAPSFSDSAELQLELFKNIRQWFRVVILLTGSAAVCLCADLLLRSGHQDRPAMQKISELGLSWTALAPAGTAFIRPELSHPGVDLRFIPALSREAQSTGLFKTSPMPLSISKAAEFYGLGIVSTEKRIDRDVSTGTAY